MPPQFAAGRRRRRHLLLLAAAGISTYATYRLLRRLSLAAKLRRLSSLGNALVASAQTLTLLSDDLKSFLLSDSHNIPNSFIQIGKILRSDEVSTSVSRVSEAVTAGIVRGLSSEFGDGGHQLSERVLDRILSPEGSGFVSVVIGSFARNLVIAYYSRKSEGVQLGRIAQFEDSKGFELRDKGVRDGDLGDLICDDRFRDLVGDCVQRFVSTGVTVFLEKTKGINSYDEMFSGLTNPRHEAKIKDVLVSVCNGAVETLVKTSHQVMMVGSSRLPNSVVGEDANVAYVSHVVRSVNREVRSIGGSNRTVADVGGWVSHVSSTLAVPSNRRLVLDVTGRVTLETVRSLLEFFLRKLHSAGRRSASVFREEVVERGLDIVRYISAKSMTVLTICIALCVQLAIGTRLLVPV